jgi:hypothetical protein
MGKKIVLAMALCACFLSNAQSSKREEGIKLGIKGGINLSNFNGDLEDNATRYGLHIGMVSEIILSDKFSFQPELLYSAQGYKNETPDAFSKDKFDYINLPLMIKYYAADKFSIEAGPQVGFLINSKRRGNDGNTDIDDQNAVDFGINAGIGYELKNGIFFQGRYNLGITNVNGAPDADAFKYTNSVFQISVGVLF